MVQYLYSKIKKYLYYMIINIIVILKLYLILLFNRKGCPYSVPMSDYGHPVL